MTIYREIPTSAALVDHHDFHDWMVRLAGRAQALANRGHWADERELEREMERCWSFADNLQHYARQHSVPNLDYARIFIEIHTNLYTVQDRIQQRRRGPGARVVALLLQSMHMIASIITIAHGNAVPRLPRPRDDGS